MILNRIIKIFSFILLLFVFSCGDNQCSYIDKIADAVAGETVGKSPFQGTPEIKQGSKWLTDLAKTLPSSVLDRLFGKPVPSDTKGMVGMRQMIAKDPQSSNVKLSPIKDVDRGTVYSMYAGIVQSTEYRATYYLGLTLYIVILGFTYLLGMTDLSLQKAIPIFIKVGVISLFTNPTLSTATGMPIGWSAYYNIIVGPSLYAMESFAMYFCAALFEIDIKSIDNGFAPLTIAFTFLFSSTFWIKMTTIVFGGVPVGFATFVIICVSMVMYMISAVLSLMSYVVIIGTLGILFAIGPIFFIFLLFEKTKVYFEKWWKQVLALMLQQYTLFIAITVFGFIIIKCAQAMLSFDVYCKSIIKLGFLPNIPLINFEIPLFSYYAPQLGDAGLLTLAMYAIFFFMLVSIYATSIEKIADISSGLMDGISGVKGSMGMTKSAFDATSKQLQSWGGNALKNTYQPDKMYMTGKNIYNNITDKNKSNWNKFTNTASALNPFSEPKNATARLGLKTDAEREKEKEQAAARKVEQENSRILKENAELKAELADKKSKQ